MPQREAECIRQSERVTAFDLRGILPELSAQVAKDRARGLKDLVDAEWQSAPPCFFGMSEGLDEAYSSLSFSGFQSFSKADLQSIR